MNFKCFKLTLDGHNRYSNPKYQLYILKFIPISTPITQWNAHTKLFKTDRQAMTKQIQSYSALRYLYSVDYWTATEAARIKHS